MADEPQTPQSTAQASPVTNDAQPVPEEPAAAASAPETPAAASAQESQPEAAAASAPLAALSAAAQPSAAGEGSASASTPVSGETSAAAPSAAAPAAGQPAAAGPAPAGAVPPPPGGSTPAAAAAGPPVPQPPAASAQPKPVFAKGCVAAAWDDIKATPNWLSRRLLLGLIACVPILNFVTVGYLLNWVREVPFGGRTTMPKPIVTGRNFEVGFYAFVILLVFGLVGGVANAILMWIPILGWLAALAVMVLVEMVGTLGIVRMALSKQIGEGFRVGKLWEALKANWTGLLVASIVPGLLVGIAVVAIFTVVFLLAFLVAAVPLAAVGATGSASAGLGGLIVGLGLGGALLFVAYYLVACVASTFAYALSFRAVAHFVGRYAPAWANEARVAMGYPAE